MNSTAMNPVVKSPPSDSSAGSPESYQGQIPAAAIYHPKNPYRQGAGPQQNLAPIPQYPGNGIQYPNPMALPNGQYYAPIPAANAGFVPVYAGGAPPEHIPYYFYPGPNSWAMHGPMQLYHPQVFNVSPPGTPQQGQIPYRYTVVPPGQEFLPPSPPNVPHLGTNGYGVPPLEYRRGSWSSSGATDTPTTPFTTGADPVPTIVGEGQASSPTDDNQKDLDKTVENLLLSGPPLPRPIPGLYMSGTVKTLSQTLDNPTNTTNVYIRGLPPDMNDDALYEMTCRFGTVTSHKAIMDTEHGTCKGYGFARFDTITDAECCIRGLVSQKYEAGFARESFNARLKTLADPNSTNIYVSNLPRDMNEKDMQDIFADYVVVSNRILRDANGNSRGVGFARFESRDICDEIIRIFHGKPVGIEGLPLQVRYADTSAQKRLKATTTKKRQFRTNEYNSIVNGDYFNIPHPATRFGNRMWLRQSSMSSNMSNDSGVTLPPYPPKGSGRNWESSQDWAAGGNDENQNYKPAGTNWRNVSGSSGANGQDKLETVHETDDGIAETHSDVTTVPNILEGLLAGSISKSSSGSFSDPGDSYGGREYDEPDTL